MPRRLSLLKQASSCAERLRVLGDPTRLAVMEQLMEGPKHVGALTDTLGVEQSLMSYHLQTLRMAGLVHCRRQGKSVLYSVSDETIAAHGRPAQGPARWFQCVTLNARPLRISQWMGGSGWNSTWWYTSADVQLWLLCMIFALLPGAWLVGALFRRRRLIGLRCLSCGYDLRATPGRCPECGAVPAGADHLSRII